LKKSEDDFSASILARVLFEDLGLRPDASLKIAYSGGLDSHSLLHALVLLRATAPLRLEAVHVDHGLQPASQEWSRHCQQVCAALGVSCRVERLEVRSVRGRGLEAAARQARYDALIRYVRAGDVLVTAHQQDDQAETVLLQLLRGTGVRGLAGMPALAPFGDGYLARPLLGFSRAALHTYALDQGVIWVEDNSNQDTRYRRNRLRQQVIPLLETYWPHARTLLARNASHAAQTAELLDEVAQQDLAHCLAVERGPTPGDGTCARRLHARPLSVAALCALSRPRRHNLLRYWIRMRGFQAPSAQHLDEIDVHITRLPRTHQARIAWPQAEVRRYRDELYVMAPLTRIAAELALLWDLSAPVVIPGTGYRLKAVAAVGRGLARGHLQSQPIQVRLRQGGEVCRPQGHAHQQKLKKLLQACGIEPWLRGRMPLVYIGDELAAVADLWVCEPYAARPDEPGIVLVWESCLS